MMLSHHMMSEAEMRPVMSRREVMGMRRGWPTAVMGLMTVVRVLPDDLYDRVMNSDEPIAGGEVFEEIVRRYGKPAMYEPAKGMMHDGHGGTMQEGHEGHGDADPPSGHEGHHGRE